MKTLLALSLVAAATLAPAQAQILRPEAANGAVIGAAAGAIIGHNSGSLGHNAWRGAAYGAGAGLLIGSAIGESNYRSNAHRPPVYTSYYGRPRGYGYGYYNGGYGYYSRPYVYAAAPVYYDNADYYVSSRPNYAGNGLFLGALAGAIIGNNSGSLGHNAWRGAAYGAGAGLLIGAIAENSARRSEAAAQVTYAQPTAPAVTQTAPAGQQATTIINNNYYNSAPATPMSSANSMFGRN